MKKVEEMKEKRLGLEQALEKCPMLSKQVRSTAPDSRLSLNSDPGAFAGHRRKHGGTKRYPRKVWKAEDTD